MITLIKDYLFQIGLYNKCPECGSRLKEYGFTEFGHKYKCTKCKWGHVKENV